MIIREANEDDLENVLQVERDAFGEEDEAELVRNLLDDPSAKPIVSLLAFEDERAVGHILFTKVNLSGGDVSGALLAPLAVIPKAQSRGIGTGLIEEGLRLLAQSSVNLVFVLGHPDYYPRCGFQPAGAFGYEAPYPILPKNADAWMVKELRQDSIGKGRGKVICAKVIDKPEYWSE